MELSSTGKLGLYQEIEGSPQPLSSRSFSHNSTSTSPKRGLPGTELFAIDELTLFPHDNKKSLADNYSNSFNDPSTSSSKMQQSPMGAREQKLAETASKASLDETQSDKNPEDSSSVYINFNNIGMVEYIRFISRTINKNFIFDENDLQFNVTIISDEATTLENIMTALLQELRIHGLSLIEQGNNLIIHKNKQVNAISQVIAEDIPSNGLKSEIVTQVFQLNTADPERVAAVIRPLTSEFALVDVLGGTNHLIITDLSTNVTQIAKLIKSVDSPNSGLVIGQYAVRTTTASALLDMADLIIRPISQDQPLRMVPWAPSNSVFIVSTPYIVERALSILQHIDQNQKSTKIFNVRDLDFSQPVSSEQLPPPRLSINGQLYTPREDEVNIRPSLENFDPRQPNNLRLPDSQPGFFSQPEFSGQSAPFNQQDEKSPNQPNAPSSAYNRWLLDPNGNWKLKVPSNQHKGPQPPQGRWIIDSQGFWKFIIGSKETETQAEESIGVPNGEWQLEPSGGWTFNLDEGESILVRRLSRPLPLQANIPLGLKRKNQFVVYKLEYRKGDAIQRSLQAIASSLLSSPDSDPDIIATMTSVQWLETSNSLIFTGYPENLLRIRELMHEIDTPLRQVFIEMLILETSIEDSLEYSVTWGTRFAGDHWAGAEGFNQTGGTNLTSPIHGAINTAGVNETLGAATANSLIATQGLNIGVVGQKIVNTALGIEYNSIGALLQALRIKNNTNVILNPKIITEDSVPAEIFVGENIPFKTQSISNDQGSNITTNFQFRDVGTRFRVTPTLGNNDIISLEIAQEISAIIPSAPGGANINNAPQGPSTTKSTTTTRVHLPSGYFLIISGMMRDQFDQAAIQVPCLGAIPVLGAAFKDKSYGKRKRNQMIFIRPVIVETEEEIQNLTRHQQDIWEFKKQFPMKRDWIYETEGALDFLNLRRNPQVETDPVRQATDF